MALTKPRYRPKRVTVTSQVDEQTRMMLDMLGFDVPKLIEEMLNNVAGHKKCPCCQRELKPKIVPRNLD